MRGADRKEAWACCAAYSPSWTNPRLSGMLGTLSSEQQDRELARLRDELARHKGLHRQNDGLQRQNERLRRENEHLKQQLGAERRAGRRQAAPFAKDRPQGRGGRPGRRPGARYGRQGRLPCPARVDETLAAPASATCPELRRRGRSDRRGVAVSGRPSPGAPAGAPLRHRGRPLLAVSAAYPGPTRQPVSSAVTTGEWRTCSRRPQPLVVGGRHPDDDRLRHLRGPRIRRRPDGPRVRLRRRARARRVGGVPPLHPRGAPILVCRSSSLRV